MSLLLKEEDKWILTKLNITIKEAVNLYIKSGFDVMTSIKKVAKDRGLPKNDIYKEYHEEDK